MDAILLYLITAMGGAAVYCLAPRPTRSLTFAGGLIGAAALALLLVYLALRFGASPGIGGFFYLFSGVAILAAARVVTHPKPVYSALYFILVILSVAGLLLLLAAEFLAAALVIIYAGAILVTYVFVIMLAQQSEMAWYDRTAREPLAAVLVGFLLAGTVAARLATGAAGSSESTVPAAPSVASIRQQPTAANEGPEIGGPGNTRAVGSLVLTDYVVTLEVAGVLLLVAMIGAVILARRPLPQDVTRTGAPPRGEVGRHVRPF